MAAMAVMGFIAAFIDSVVGGGGLISVPTLMWAGLPMLSVLGTNNVIESCDKYNIAMAFTHIRLFHH